MKFPFQAFKKLTIKSMIIFNKIKDFFSFNRNDNFASPDPDAQLLEKLLDTIGVHCWYKNKNGKYIGFNQSIAKTLGLQSPDEILGKTDYEMSWYKQADILIQNDQMVMDSGKIHTQEELVTIPSGKTLTFLVTKAPYRNKDGEIIGTIGTSLNITPLKEADQLKTEFIRNGT